MKEVLMGDHAVARGVQLARAEVIAAYPITPQTLIVEELSEICARGALREALQKGGSVLLEPIMKVEVVTVAEYTGSVIGDLNSRRGHIQGQDVRGNANVINAMVPLANMFSYVNNLRSMSQGRATFTMQFDHYEEVPRNVALEVQAKYA